MKKIALAVAGTVVSLGLSTGAALADQTCSISGPTGPLSTNTCNNTSASTIVISCTNKLDVLNINGQASSSGNATANGNTGAGSVQSGTSGNISFNTNTDNLSCAPAQQAAAQVGGQGGGSQAAPAASAPAAAKALPSTGSDSKAVTAVAATAVFAGLAAVARFGAVAYRKLF